MAEIYIADKPTLDSVNTKMDASISSRAAQTTVNTINSNVGSNADAPSASGSVHAKLKDLKTAVSSSGKTLRSRFFTESGTFTVPSGVTEVFITGTGAGGGANSGSTAPGSGGAGDFAIKAQVTVVPNTTHTITIGVGGRGYLNASSQADSGGVTSFGSLFSLSGGGGGKPGGGLGAGFGGDGTSGYSSIGGNGMFFNPTQYAMKVPPGVGGAGGGLNSSGGKGGDGFVLVEWYQ